LLDIILVDDDPDHRIIMKSRLGKIFSQCKVSDFADASTCLDYLDEKQNVPDMVISDLFLEDTMDGIDLFRELQKRKIPSQFILVSSNGKELADKQSELRNGDLCLLKEQFLKGNIEILRERIKKKRVF
jgi:DNA-binding NtrC family response regulator